MKEVFNKGGKMVFLQEKADDYHQAVLGYRVGLN
jgi:hypothetical protein